MTTTSFNGLAKIEATALGLPEIQICAVPHPLGAGLPEDQVRAKAEAAVATLVKLITGQE
ncbi:hypothetical protein FPZ12_008185 [Amycolatopsis acidicola]|uniref:UGSC-like domain-containing protein n=1 Tax=Amycolatopsis acidicola TaxID=2596893 RepID=A0A5N0VF10_9PSEU|nr:hypothetical protein FPZ12_008185 [Amycolatopsis acidicola]